MPEPSLIPPTIPEDFCQLTPQEQVNLIIGGTVIAPTTSFDNLLIQASMPNPNQRSKAWLRLEGGDLTPDKIYKYALGAWLSKHPVPASGDARQMWVGSELSLQTYDGGDGDPVGPAAGPMWEVDHDYDGRMPMGPGAIPGSNPADTIAVGEEKGSGSHTLTVAELPAHNHPPLNAGGNVDGFLNHTTTTGNPYNPTGSGDAVVEATTGNTGGDTPFSTLSPALGTFFIKRTARIFYKAT